MNKRIKRLEEINNKLNESDIEFYDDDDFDEDVSMIIYSHLSDIQETCSGATRNKINFIKSLVDMLESGKKKIPKPELDFLSKQYKIK